jgi:hypothetical protein
MTGELIHDAARIIAVNGDDLRTAFEWVSAGTPSENAAYVSIESGRIYWTSIANDMEEDDLPEDLEDASLYIAVPHKNDLDLGSRLVLRFVARELPDDYGAVADFFRRRRAYARFKDLLHRRRALQRWYDFEERATEEALLAWCAQNGIRCVAEQPVGPGVPEA